MLYAPVIDAVPVVRCKDCIHSLQLYDEYNNYILSLNNCFATLPLRESVMLDEIIGGGGGGAIPVQLDEGAFMPERAHKLDAGLDLRSPVDILVPCSGGSAIIDTGVHVQLPPDSVGMLKSKSGLNVKHDITSEGVIDCGYDGSIVVKLYNHSDTPYQVRRGDKISQLVILPVLYLSPIKVDKIQGGERGDNGFGSTGR